ncbi:MAG TPA: M14 family zinc carboxypeptidase [Nocardioides sp.]|uniref:M14 family zinc carboxypeptidase n=1 Tax=Nocardioides sp. TaxID=35761 RepID=UPI002F3EACE0
MSRVARTRRTPLLGGLLSLALLPGFLLLPSQATQAADGRPAVIGKQVIGTSVQGRKIVAWHLGEPGRKKVVLISLMHGNEPAPRRILMNLVNGDPVHELDLWVVPVYNPDGYAHHTRRNAHGVDLNRNYPYRWVPLDGSYESGPAPRSEPETRAMIRFLARVQPAYVLSFHQPLHAVDVTERPKFSRKVARALGLPTSHLRCGSTCHGTMTMWFNHRFPGFALTVEYGAHPSRARLRAAPDKILQIFGAWRGGVKGVE